MQTYSWGVGDVFSGSLVSIWTFSARAVQVAYSLMMGGLGLGLEAAITHRNKVRLLRPPAENDAKFQSVVQHTHSGI